jgi:carboxymethylenebutenolidase
MAKARISERQRRLIELWEQHVGFEFDTRDTDATLDTMVPETYVNHVPVKTGGRGREELREFYGHSFISRMPHDAHQPYRRRQPPRRRNDFRIHPQYRHALDVPGVPPTGKPVKVALVAIVGFECDKLVHEQIYWDQASVLVQLGLLNPAGLPVTGVDSALKALDPTLPPRQI